MYGQIGGSRGQSENFELQCAGNRLETTHAKEGKGAFRVEGRGDNKLFIAGWACVIGEASSGNVQITASGGIVLKASTPTTRASEQAVLNECQASSGTHRFAFEVNIPAALRSAPFDVMLHVRPQSNGTPFIQVSRASAGSHISTPIKFSAYLKQLRSGANSGYVVSSLQLQDGTILEKSYTADTNDVELINVQGESARSEAKSISGVFLALLVGGAMLAIVTLVIVFAIVRRRRKRLSEEYALHNQKKNTLYEQDAVSNQMKNDWTAHVHPESGQIYWHNQKTGETKYDDGTWEKNIDEASGYKYVYNKTTGETQWVDMGLSSGDWQSFPNDMFNKSHALVTPPLRLRRSSDVRRNL